MPPPPRAGEVEARGVSRGYIGIGADGATCQLDVGRSESGMQAGVPAQNDRFKTADVYGLWPQLPKYWHQVKSVFEAAAPPTPADFASQRFADENPPVKICASEKELRFSSPVAPATQTPTSQLRCGASGRSPCA
jgi:hypothetical protein